MKSILIVDDEESMRNLYQEYLRHELGLQDLSFSEDGIDAYMKCAIKEFYFIILDHKMPRLTGLELLIAVRSTPGPNQNTPIYVISGELPEINLQTNILKNTFFLSKPFNFNELNKYFKKVA